MRIAVSSKEKGLDSDTDRLFSRCVHFTVMDTDDISL
jgi:predicted Fe-Mo cluster-binding NifX family protein